MKKIILPYIFSVILFLTACGGSKTMQKEHMPYTEQDIVSGMNNFAFDMLKNLSGKNVRNTFYSPLSISSALAMTYAGAEGKTVEEMRKTLYLGPQDTSFHSKYGGLIKTLQSSEDSDFTMHIANAVWVHKDYSLRKDYLNIVREYYYSESREIDFVSAPEVSRRTINEWVSQATNDRIRDLIPSGGIDALTRLILTNAVYFNAEWEEAFNKEMTRQDDFYPLTGEAFKTDMMYKRHHFSYSETEEYRVLEIDYKGQAQQMLVFLPGEKNGLGSLVNMIGTKELIRHEENKSFEDVILYLPKFRIETKYELNAVLQQLGMDKAFTRDADFSGMTGKRDLMISNVIHKAFIEVDEYKTEAAAATAVIMRLTAMPPAPRAPIEFRADHPFLFMIRDKQSGAILFIGCVTDPAEVS